MAKKRQQDFQKTQMKPGRTVAKRKNVTNVSFKSKKIALPSKGSKPNVSAKTIPDCLTIIKNSHSVPAKTSALDDLNKLIGRSRSSLSSHLSEILEGVAKLILDVDDNLRNPAISVLESILHLTNDVQIQTFVPVFVNVISCAMTHSSIKIKENSLTLLSSMIKQHPDLSSHCIRLLDPLISMLSGSPRTRTHSQQSKQNLPVMYSDGILSPHWRMKLLGHINAFLKSILKNKPPSMNDNHEEQEIYWDSKSPLYLQIYAGSGLKPLDIEKCYSNYNASQEFINGYNILMPLDHILSILPSLFIEETASLFENDDHLLDSWTISSLNIMFDVLNTLSEWLDLIPSDDMKNRIRMFLKVNIYEKDRFPFKRRGAVHGKTEETVKCVQLNLNICYLFCSYLLEVVDNKQELCETVFSYVKTVFKMPEAVKCQSIPVLVKITKIFFGMRETAEEFLYGSLFQLCSLLKISDNHPNRHLLTSLFTKMSLDSAYHFVAETDVMKEWYRWLLNKMREVPKTNIVDKEVFRVVKKIANRRYPCFQKLLMQIDFPVIKAMLQYDDDDLRDAAVFLIYNMKDINTNLLDNIACMILTDSSLPRKFALRLMRVLTYRFSEKPLNGKKAPEASIYSPRGLIDIIQFFLNIAIDSVNINNEKFTDFEANEYTKAVKIIRDAAPYSILPSVHWKEHSELFQVCTNFLSQLPQKIVNDVAIKLFKEILDNSRVLPMHVVISLLKLNKREMKERYFRIQIHELNYSALLTTSIITRMSIDDDWTECNVSELINSMNNSHMSDEALHVVNSLRDDELEGIVAYHILRVLKFLFESDSLRENDYKTILKTMEILKDKCSDKTIQQQPLYISLFNHFSSFM